MAPLSGFNVDTTIGAMFLGCIFSALLYGIILLQVYIYYSKYPKDYTFHKIMVAILFVLNSAHLGFTIAAVYRYVITHFGDVYELMEFVWPLKAQIALNCIIIMLVQMLYATRVWRLGRHYGSFVPIVVVGLVAVGWGCTIMLMVKISTTHTFFGLSRDTPYIVYASLSALTIIDVAIASSMCFYLSKSKTNFDKTNSMILNVMKMTLASGFITSACSLTVLIVFLTKQKTMIFICIQFLLTELYVISYFSMLTARERSNYTFHPHASISQNIMSQPSATSRFRASVAVPGDIALHSTDEKLPIPRRLTDSHETLRKDFIHVA